MIQNISQWNPTLKEFRRRKEFELFCNWIHFVIWHCFFAWYAKRVYYPPYIRRARPCLSRREQMHEVYEKKYIFQTLNIDGKEMLVIYKNNVYDITPKQDEISVTFFFHVVHTRPHFVPHPPRNSISYQAISRPLQRVQQNNVLCLSS